MIPAIFMHRGDGEMYLEPVMRQAQEFDNHVILIGDDRNAKFSSIVEHHLISDYKNTSNEFVKCYEPLSTHGDYETFCFERWFILYEFMQNKNLDKCFYFDSDIMFYANTEDEAKKFEQFDLTLVHKSAGCSSYITFKGLKDFCKKTFEIYYKRGFEFDKLKAFYQTMQNHGRTGGVCDMTLLEHYSRYTNPAGVGEMMYIVDNTTYDHCINQADQNYEMENGIKKIQMINNRPHCKQLTTGKIIQFNTLHFQGECKGLIPKFFVNVHAS